MTRVILVVGLCVSAVGTSYPVFGDGDQPDAARRDEVVEAQRQIVVLDALAFPWRWPFVEPGTPVTDVPASRITAREWSLLLKEAAQHQARPSAEQVRSFLASRMIVPERIRQLAGRLDCSEESIESAVAGYLNVRELCKHTGPAPSAADDEAFQKVLDTISRKIRVRAALLDSSPLIDPAEQIPEAELQELYDACKDTIRSRSADGIGYCYPTRIAIEYVGLRVDDVKKLFPVTEAEARQYFKDNPGYFVTAEARRAGKTAFEDHRDVVVERMQIVRLKDRVTEAMGRLSDVLKAPWKNVPVDKFGFKVAPEEVKKPNYMKELADRFKSETGLPFVYVKTPLFSKEEAGSLPNVGEVVYYTVEPKGGRKGRWVNFPNLAFRVQGPFLVKDAHIEGFPLALYEPSPKPVLSLWRFKPASSFLYRVVEVQMPHPPANLAEVRSQVLADARQRSAMDRAGKYALELADTVAQVGLSEALAQRAKELQRVFGEMPEVAEPAPFPKRRIAPSQEHRKLRIVTKLPRIQQDWAGEQFVDTCFAMVEDASLAASAPVHESTVCKLQRSNKWAVIELLETLPAEPLAPQRLKVVRRWVAEENLYKARLDWLAEDAISLRIKTE